MCSSILTANIVIIAVIIALIFVSYHYSFYCCCCSCGYKYCCDLHIHSRFFIDLFFFSCADGKNKLTFTPFDLTNDGWWCWSKEIFLVNDDTDVDESTFWFVAFGLPTATSNILPLGVEVCQGTEQIYPTWPKLRITRTLTKEKRRKCPSYVELCGVLTLSGSYS